MTDELTNVRDIGRDQPPILPGLAVERKLGDGGMATVWLATDRLTGIKLAVKVLKPEFSASREDVEHFIAESSAMETINHEGIVKSYGADVFDGKAYYIMEYVDGYSFGQLLERKQHLPEEDCLLICESVAAALDYAWNNYGIVHCDIKPDNIMINGNGIVKLTDLGLSHTFKFLKEGQIDIPDHVLGTPAYISPEQIYGDVELDCRADIYSLGATLYHLATGRVLFPHLGSEETMRAHCDAAQQAPDPRKFHRLSHGFCQLLEVMLVKDRDYRIRTWADVFEVCREVEAGAEFAPRSNAYPSSIGLLPAPSSAS